MSWQETIIKTNNYNCHNTLEERLNEQAEISYKAGIKELVEWFQARDKYQGNLTWTVEWQAQLEKWEVK